MVGIGNKLDAVAEVQLTMASRGICCQREHWSSPLTPLPNLYTNLTLHCTPTIGPMVEATPIPSVEGYCADGVRRADPSSRTSVYRRLVCNRDGSTQQFKREEKASMGHIEGAKGR